MTRVGLALSGAVARGPAHVGVLSVLERAVIPIECVAGASAGAFAGALFCAGFSTAQAEALAPQFGWRKVACPVWPRRGYVTFDKLERWLMELIGDVRFDQLQKPLAIVATDLNTGEPVVLREGRVAPAVRASASVPGFVEPVEINGRLLGDGSISYNLPVNAARALGADFVIGVDLFQPKLRRSWGPLGFGFLAIETLVQRSGGGREQADFLITPELAGISYLNFGNSAELIARGRRATEAALPDLRKQLSLGD